VSPPRPPGVIEGDGESRPERTVDDVTRRTYLANERTYLAWWRTGIASLATSIGVGRIVPSLTHANRVPYAILGAGFALVGIAMLGYGLKRHREVICAVERGEYTHPNDAALVAFTAAGVILGALLLIVVLFDG
jgi:putative membrane protein